MEWLKQRSGEASTWRGIGFVLVALGLVPAGSVDLLVSAGVALAGFVEVMRSEK